MNERETLRDREQQKARLGKRPACQKHHAIQKENAPWRKPARPTGRGRDASLQHCPSGARAILFKT
ncbi:hypothetical protein J6590_056440 [Homalodisca vitripennis]|nr:hypothetical protein J6590_056440 [Homalodisca vitripennis]